jgi:hypothetical protein
MRVQIFSSRTDNDKMLPVLQGNLPELESLKQSDVRAAYSNCDMGVRDVHAGMLMSRPEIASTAEEPRYGIDGDSYGYFGLLTVSFC